MKISNLETFGSVRNRGNDEHVRRPQALMHSHALTHSLTQGRSAPPPASAHPAPCRCARRTDRGSGRDLWARAGGSGPRAEEDRLLEEDVLLSERVECSLLRGAVWSQEGTAVDARVRASGRGQKTRLLASAVEVQPRFKNKMASQKTTRFLPPRSHRASWGRHPSSPTCWSVGPGALRCLRLSWRGRAGAGAVAANLFPSRCN